MTYVSCFVTIANPHNRGAPTFVDDLIRPGSYRWIPSQFCATNQTHKVWPNMDTSPLNEWQYTQTHAYRSGGDLWQRAPSRGTGSLTGYRGTPVPHRTCITTHMRSFRATIALPPRRLHAGRLTNREGKTENPQSLHTWCRIVSEYRGVSNER